MPDNKNLETRIGLNSPSKVTPAQKQSFQAYLKEQKAAQSIEEQLEEALLHLQIEMQTCVQASHPSEVESVGFYIEKGMQLFKEIAKVPKKQLAEIWGMKHSNLRKYIEGARPLTPTLARRIAISFNIPFDLLLKVDLKNTAAEMRKLQEQEPAGQYTIHSILNSPA